MKSRIAPVILGALLLTAAGCGPGNGSSDPAGLSVGGEADVAPSGLPLVEGVPVIEVLEPPERGAGEAPLFRWEPVTGASRYSVAVIGPEGPLWAWLGEETEVYLGGLPFERPAGWTGPVIVAGSCWSVIARDADGHVVAVSEFLPVSPLESPGHTCVPGTGVVNG